MLIYGIPNCDTMKKARVWLEEQGFKPQLHNYKKDGLSADLLATWVERLGWEVLVNKRGTTWRNLEPEQKENLDAQKAQALMLENTSLIKRPVLVYQDKLLVGFVPAEWQEQLGLAN